jgi:ferrous iron transport protein B
VAAPGWIEGLIIEGVIPGVGGVLTFVPGLMALFFFIGLLEDSGYLARAAVVMDRFMGALGLRGRSFVPLILGFGCAVPAIYATRTLESRRDRILTSLLIPLMSCSARLPVYVVFGLAFFGRQADLVIWGLYALGVVMAAFAGAVFSRTVFRTPQPSPFLLELPAYSMPDLRGLWRQIARRTGSFIRNAGTVILAASVIVWLLLNLPLGVQSLQESWFGGISAAVAPVLEPAGFGRWEPAGSLMSGLIAKEVVVATMSQIYLGAELNSGLDTESSLLTDLRSTAVGFVSASAAAGREMVEVLTPFVDVFPAETQVEDTMLSSALRQFFTPLSALAFLVFVLMYIPCIATLGALRGEFGWRWAWFAALWQTGGAWLLATIVYQGGRIMGLA